jgi:predicted RNase H-like nuclease
VMGQAPPPGAGPDDLLDALACAAAARRILAGQAVPFPDPPLRDECGLPVAIWA